MIAKWIFFLTPLFLLLAGCGGGSAPAGGSHDDSGDSSDPKYALTYKGLRFYSPNLPYSAYTLPQLDDAAFNALTPQQKKIVADKLLCTLFFGYPPPLLEQKIASGHFISDLKSSLRTEKNDLSAIEEALSDDTHFFHASWTENEVLDILARLTLFSEPDRHFLNAWSAYILTQTIMFSPAYELESTHNPNIARVYNRLFRGLEEEQTMRYLTYLHMISSDNWRRFRSPEDNGREMMEIYLQQFDDTKVPIAGKALQNWKLDRDSDTLVIGLNENRTPLQLFGTTVKNGDDFYRELAKSDAFMEGVTRRVVDFFFTNASQAKKEQIARSLINSHPQTWQDLLVQILFSRTYLLECDAPKSAEALFMNLFRKMEYKPYNRTFYYLYQALDEMHQASMKYKLGKLTRVPLDTLSFINYHKYIREQIMIRPVNPDKLNNYSDWDSYGWKPSFIDTSRFSLTEDPKASLERLIRYLFDTIIQRAPTSQELALFENHMLKNEGGRFTYRYAFNLQTDRRQNAAIVILDYLSRIATLYQYQKVSS